MRSFVVTLLSLASCLTPSFALGLQHSARASPSTLQSYNGWTIAGCYVDSVSARVLPIAETTVGGGGSMTVEHCLDACQASGYKFAGLEYSAECYCGTTMPTQVATDGRCNMVCNGNSLEYCGGSNGLTVYTFGTATTTTTTAAATTTSSGPSTLQSYNGWTSDGCYVDSVSARVLPNAVSTVGGGGSLTVELCLNACQAAGYKFAGVEYSAECYCGATMPTQVATDGRCNMVCNGNHLEYCGGSNGLNVYTFGTAIASTTTTHTASATTTTTTTTTTTHAATATCATPLGSGNAAAGDPWWLQSMPHVGTAAFNPSPSTYKVYRNVKDYGAVGDGVHDDTAAINAAISDQNRCGNGCKSSTTTPALVYFPSGSYLVSTPIIPYYYTALVGDAKNRPTLIAAASFSGIAVIDADPYIANGQYWVNQNNFFRAVRNFNIDLTRMPVTSTATGLHWQVAQATSLQYVKVIMSQDPSTQHQGIFMENGSGGFLGDLEFVGGRLGVFVGNQQFTVRNVQISNAQIAIQAIWNWGWTWQNVQISNCGVGIQMTTGGTTLSTQTVGSEVLLDFTVTNTPVFIQTTTAQTTSLAGSIYIDNAHLTNVPVVVGTTSGTTVLAGSTGTMTVTSWAQGNIYSGSQSTVHYVQSNITPPSKPASLLDGTGKVFGQGRPQYENYSTSQFVSVKAHGAVGDGSTDDTAALQAIFNQYAGCKIIFFDAGTYLISNTLNIPVGTDMIGEMWSQILIKGSVFNDQNNPHVALKFGNTGDVGSLRVTDIVVSTYAGSVGAIAMEINIQESSQGSVGFWDTHVRLGGSTGTGLTVTQCQKLQGHGLECGAAFLSAHITSGASAYMENVWLWTADHQLDNDTNETQIDIFAGRGFLVEGTNVWLVGTAAEHHVIYQYSFSSATNVYAGLIQTETPYFQPSPSAPSPFSTNPSFHDPDVSSLGSALALSIVNSASVFIYGAGHYSFFRAYSQDCLTTNACQSQIAAVSSSTNVRIYGLSTIGVTYELTVSGTPTIPASNNPDGLADTVTAWSSDTLTVQKKKKRGIRHKRTPFPHIHGRS